MYKTEADACNTVDPRTPRYYEAMIAALLQRVPNIGPQRIPLRELAQETNVRYEYEPDTGMIAVSLGPIAVNPTDCAKAWHG